MRQIGTHKFEGESVLKKVSAKKLCYDDYLEEKLEKANVARGTTIPKRRQRIGLTSSPTIHQHAEFERHDTQHRKSQFFPDPSDI